MQDWERHVRHEPRSREALGRIGDERELPPGSGVAWCGEHLAGWYYQDASHAIYSVEQEQQMQPCPACVAAIVRVLVPEVIATLEAADGALQLAYHALESSLSASKRCKEARALVRAALAKVRP